MGKTIKSGDEQRKNKIITKQTTNLEKPVSNPEKSTTKCNKKVSKKHKVENFKKYQKAIKTIGKHTNSNHNFISQAIQCQLLLDYNFIIDDFAISVGFMPITNFDPSIILRQNGNNVYMTESEFLILYENIEKIQKFFNCKTQQNERTIAFSNKYQDIIITLKHVLNEPTLHLSNDGFRPNFIKKQGWEQFLRITNFLKHVLNENQKMKNNICDYFSQYCTKCCENNTQLLNDQHFFLPEKEKNAKIYFYRLFCEIPIKCQFEIDYFFRSKNLLEKLETNL